MKTSEMIAMLEKNPKLKFKTSNPFIAANYIYVDEYGTVRWGGKKQYGELFVVIGKNADDWTLVREPVPAWEAIKAFMEGKAISCVYKEDYCDKERTFVIKPSIKGKERFEEFCFSSYLLTSGTWYIDG